MISSWHDFYEKLLVSLNFKLNSDNSDMIKEDLYNNRNNYNYTEIDSKEKEASIVGYCIRLIHRHFFDEDHMRQFLESPGIEDFLMTTLFYQENENISRIIYDFVITVCEFFPNELFYRTVFEKCFENITNPMIPRDLNRDYLIMELLIQLVRRFHAFLSERINFNKIIDIIFEYIQNSYQGDLYIHSYNRDHYQTDDSLLLSLIDFLDAIYENIKLGVEKNFRNPNLVPTILSMCIFNEENRKKLIISIPKNRRHVLKLIQTLASLSPKHFEQFYLWAQRTFRMSKYRGNTKNSWEREVNHKDKSDTGYVGIKNLGCSTLFSFLFDYNYT